MNKFILGFVFFILTARFFTETLGVLPKAIDLIDIAVIPILLVMSTTKPDPKGVDSRLHRRMVLLVGCFLVLCALSAIVNFERTSIGPVLLYVFGMLEGPIFFIALNKLIISKRKFGKQAARFMNMVLLAQILVVAFVSYPLMLASGNPDKMSGTFGNNSYQFTALLIIIGGYFIGKQYAKPRAAYLAVGIQAFVIITFLLLQYRTATPSFFVAYALLVTILYGRKFFRMGLIALPLLGIAYFGFKYINRSDLGLKYEDLVTVGEDVGMLKEYGKFLSYVNTVSMYGDYPLTVVFGCGPGTYVSRANYTFTVDLQDTRKGVGSIVTTVFGDKNYLTDVHMKYIYPLSQLESKFGSVQINNPNSSILASAAETGLPGLFIMVSIYSIVIVHSLRYLRYAKAMQDSLLLPLASALFIGATYLVLISPLDNYLEIARVTLPVWLLFWTVSTIVRQQRTEQAMMRLMAEQKNQEVPEEVPDARRLQ
ncbi:MAG: hypothetical protein ABIR47_11735 [Candidatus Kapaibacterium sp.]